MHNIVDVDRERCLQFLSNEPKPSLWLVRGVAQIAAEESSGIAPRQSRQRIGGIEILDVRFESLITGQCIAVAGNRARNIQIASYIKVSRKNDSGSLQKSCEILNYQRST